MSLPSSKEIARLAKACRKAGIKQFRCGDIEFTLEPLPTSTRRSRRGSNAAESHSPTDVLVEGALTDEELLNWSVGGGVPFTIEEGIKT